MIFNRNFLEFAFRYTQIGERTRSTLANIQIKLRYVINYSGREIVLCVSLRVIYLALGFCRFCTFRRSLYSEYNIRGEGKL